MYFYYQKDFAGRWIPCKSLEKPNEKSVNGNSFEVRQVIKLVPPFDTFNLCTLEVTHPLQEEKDGTSDTSGI